MREFFKRVPIPAAGVALGFAALGNLLQSYSEAIRIVCGIISFIFLILVIGKILFCFDTFKKEFENPIIASVFGTFFMTIMQLATYVEPILGKAALLIWLFAVAGHIILILFYTAEFLLRFKLDEVFPTCFITYVGIVVVPLTSPVFHMQTLGKLLFWFGFAAYAFTFVIITVRYFKHEIPESARPLFCIYAAPMSLTLSGYIAVMDEKSLLFMTVLQILAQILYFYVLYHLPKLLKLPFYPSYAAFTFPFVITAFALKKFTGYLALHPIAINLSLLNGLVAAETLLATFMVVYTGVHYAKRYLTFLELGKAYQK